MQGAKTICKMIKEGHRRIISVNFGKILTVVWEEMSFKATDDTGKQMMEDARRTSNDHTSSS